MLIDWFTVLAQIVNFLILLVLLRRFLYRPILNAMEERQHKITMRLREAEQREKEAANQMEEYRKKTTALEKEREQMLQDARDEADAQRKELLASARAEVEQTQARWHLALQQEKEAFVRMLYQRAGSQTAAIARQALADLANAELERQIIHVFIERIQKLDRAEREGLAESLRKPGEEITVRSAFEIPSELRQKIREAINHQLADTNGLRFVTDSQVLCGIELKTQGRKISWSLESYLESLEASLSEALQEKVMELTW